MNVDREIRKYFRVKKNDNLPYVGWLNSTRENIYDFMGQVGGYKLGAEIGVQDGKNAKQMFNRIPGLHLICIDPWHGFSQTTTETKAERHYKKCLKVLDGCDTEYKIMTSMEAVKDIPDGSLDFVYIDGLHFFDYVMNDIIAWVPKVRKGGIVAGHDYFDFYQFGVVEAVRAYTMAHNVRDWYITRAEKYSSWFWVNK